MSVSGTAIMMPMGILLILNGIFKFSMF